MAIAQVHFFSRSLSRQVTVNAIVPVGKFHMPDMPEREKKPFKTLYLLHGIFGNYTDWMVGTRIASWAEERNLAVIMPSGDNSFYVDHEKSGAMYGDYFGRELVEVTREMFPLSDKREDTFIGGLSMGGFGALRNGLKYHETFGAIAALSSALVLDNAVHSTNDTPTIIGRRGYYESVFGDLDKLLGSDKDPKALLTALKESGASIPKLYIACGTEDSLIEANRGYHKFLEDNHVEHTYVEGTGAHTWEFWDEYILKVLHWLSLA
ncbi:MAG: alpha/beta hydrolase-fold protein [Defluviitaleaceae bacterium]|nr:alpha/beta hydrolase-fold protein [Defluviitaleaceae bacterium]